MNGDLKEFKKKLGKKVVFHRKKKGLTQEELGALINIDYQSISRIENGRVNASGYILNKIAIALELTMNDLFEF